MIEQSSYIIVHHPLVNQTENMIWEKNKIYKGGFGKKILKAFHFVYKYIL